LGSGRAQRQRLGHLARQLHVDMRQVVDHALADRGRLHLRQLVLEGATMWSFSAAPWLFQNSVAWLKWSSKLGCAGGPSALELVLDALEALVAAVDAELGAVAQRVRLVAHLPARKWSCGAPSRWWLCAGTAAG
jgi:hypothetical protein